MSVSINLPIGGKDVTTVGGQVVLLELLLLLLKEFELGTCSLLARWSNTARYRLGCVTAEVFEVFIHEVLLRDRVLIYNLFLGLLLHLGGLVLL